MMGVGVGTIFAMMRLYYIIIQKEYLLSLQNYIIIVNLSHKPAFLSREVLKALTMTNFNIPLHTENSLTVRDSFV